MDNQQRKITDIEIGWLVGMIDGEGTIGISLGSKTENHYRQMIPYVNIAGTNLNALNHIIELYQLIEIPDRPKGIAHHVMWFENKNPKWKKAWIVVVRGHKRAGKLLKFIVPYLVIKKEQGEAVIDLINSREERGARSATYSQTELDIYSKIRNLNQKGSVKAFRDYTQDIVGNTMKV